MSIPLALAPLYFLLLILSGLLIDFGLAEPAQKWKDRAKALANHRDRRKTKAQGKLELLGTSRTTAHNNLKGVIRSSARSARILESSQHPRTTAPEEEISRKFPPMICEDSADAAYINANDCKGDGGDRLRLLRKVERGGTTGFRAPEILWHCRDQVRWGGR